LKKSLFAVQHIFSTVLKLASLQPKYWNNGMMGVRKKYVVSDFDTHYSTIPILQQIALKNNGFLR